MKYSVLENIKLKTSKGGLELLPGQVTTLPHKVANRLLGEGKIIPLDEKLRDIYLEAMNRINDSYISGTIKYIEKNYPDLDRQIDEVDRKINRIWESCLKGEASLNDFKAELASYKSLYMQGIELFREHLVTEDGK